MPTYRAFQGGGTSFQSNAFQATGLSTVSVSGALTFVGVIVKSITLPLLSGAITFVGVLVRRTNRPLSGALTFAGSLTRRIAKVLSGAITFLGGLIGRRVVPVDIVLVAAPSVGVVVDGAPADDVTVDIDPTYGVVLS